MSKEESLEEQLNQWENEARRQMKNGKTRRDRSKKWEEANGNEPRQKRRY